ncbi:MAG TPA: hypothetical protein VFU35_06045, partial [Jatrophihabitans sp.]|nr:hypothetical protein [Jatrophihabitans sp.]
GTAYGAVQWRTSAARRFQFAAGAMAVGCVLVAAVAASASLATVTVALVVAGLGNAPTLITGNTLVPAVVPLAAVTEAYTWLGVTVFAGIAIGSPAAGALIDHTRAGTALWASVLAGTAAVAVATVGQRALATTGRAT